MPIFQREGGTSVLRRTAEYEPRRSWRTWLIGRPLRTADAPHQTIGKTIGLAVFASDALSSTAYATDEILFVLALLESPPSSTRLPISLAIVVLLTILTLSYEQTIHAYPGGGGAYIVARDNLGELPAQTAGAALLTDYILTVSVSVASGVAQLSLRVSVPLPLSGAVVRRGGAVHHAHQPARRERIGHDFRDPHLFLPGDDVPDGRHRSHAAI